ncbi:hypothetical protein MTO96_003327 [Rhipicephalus appendiculatus]
MDVPVENVVNMAAESSSAATVELDWQAIYVFSFIIFWLVCVFAVMFSLDFLAMMLGFTKNGVKPGSLAAAWQASKHGNVKKRTFFAAMQSWGVKGVPWEVRVLLFYFAYIFYFLVLLCFLRVAGAAVSTRPPRSAPSLRRLDRRLSTTRPPGSGSKYTQSTKPLRGPSGVRLWVVTGVSEQRPKS